MAYADYAFYISSYLGNKVSDADFPRVALRASEYIDSQTFNRLIDDNTLVDDNVKKACCALAEIIDQYEKSADNGVQTIKSEKVGDYSVEYVSTKVQSYDKKKVAILRQYLGCSGLLYRGW